MQNVSALQTQESTSVLEWPDSARNVEKYITPANNHSGIENPLLQSKYTSISCLEVISTGGTRHSSTLDNLNSNILKKAIYFKGDTPLTHNSSSTSLIRQKSLENSKSKIKVCHLCKYLK
jgi:hypothetical protein